MRAVFYPAVGESPIRISSAILARSVLAHGLDAVGVDSLSVVNNAMFVSATGRLRPMCREGFIELVRGFQAAAILGRTGDSQAAMRARKSAVSHATSNLRLCPAATRMALMASPEAPAR